MALNIRKNLYVTKLLTFVTNVLALWADFNTFMTRYQYGVVTMGAIGNAATAGKLKTTTNGLVYRVAGRLYSKALTDNLWDLSTQTDTTSVQYRGYNLYLDASGTASIEAGTDATTAALAIAALPAIPTTKSLIGVYVANPSCDFNAAGGLAAQGTIYDGWATGITLTSESMTLVNP